MYILPLKKPGWNHLGIVPSDPLAAMVLWDVPNHLVFPVLGVPTKCNKQSLGSTKKGLCITLRLHSYEKESLEKDQTTCKFARNGHSMTDLGFAKWPETAKCREHTKMRDLLLKGGISHFPQKNFLWLFQVLLLLMVLFHAAKLQYPAFQHFTAVSKINKSHRFDCLFMYHTQ